MKWLKNIGPGFLVTAAFIGPGTVTTASKAGAEFGFALVWALLFSVFATIVLQEMCARLGLVTGQGLGEAIRSSFQNPVLRWAVVGLVIGAIAFGNAAFQTGNILGAAGALVSLTGVPAAVWALVIGAAAFSLLACGAYRVLERVLMLLVVVMSSVFLIVAMMVGPDWGRLAAGVVPSVPADSLLTIIALIGTTVVPYNLFLHASAVREKWPKSESVEAALKASRRDTTIAISLGGLVTLAIMATAAATFFNAAAKMDSIHDMAVQLEPLFGSASKWFFASGLLAAGLTSAITAPLAAAYATAGVLGWERDLGSAKMRIVWAVIVIAGTILAITATKPVAAIVFAQAANGILLPFVAVFLLVVMNRRDLLGQHTNGTISNLLGGGIVLVALGLGGFQLWKVFSQLDL
jgi:manganese transport protein